MENRKIPKKARFAIKAPAKGCLHWLKGFSSAAEEGNIKYENNIVYIYAGGAWRQIFPAL